VDVGGQLAFGPGWDWLLGQTPKDGPRWQASPAACGSGPMLVPVLKDLRDLARHKILNEPASATVPSSVPVLPSLLPSQGLDTEGSA